MVRFIDKYINITINIIIVIIIAITIIINFNCLVFVVHSIPFCLVLIMVIPALIVNYPFLIFNHILAIYFIAALIFLFPLIYLILFTHSFTLSFIHSFIHSFFSILFSLLLLFSIFKSSLKRMDQLEACKIYLVPKSCTSLNLSFCFVTIDNVYFPQLLSIQHSQITFIAHLAQNSIHKLHHFLHRNYPLIYDSLYLTY